MSSDSQTTTHDSRFGLQGFLLLDGFIRVFIWWTSIVFTALLYVRFAKLPSFDGFGTDLGQTWSTCASFGEMVILYNLVYVAELIALRLVLRGPKEGIYTCDERGRPSRHLLRSALIATLVKARLHAPFPGFLVFHVANLPPLKWLMGPIFGPKSKSCYIAEPCILDPHLVEIGKNVVIGFGTTIAGHFQERDRVIIHRTIIEDDVLIGGHSAVAGAHIKKGAVIGPASVLIPGTVVGPNEYWSGNPARRRRVLPNQADGTANDSQKAESRTE